MAAVHTPAVFQVEPLDAAPVSLARREWSTEPEVRIRHYTDLYGNPCTRVMLPAGCSTLRFGASALVPVDKATSPVRHDRTYGTTMIGQL